MADTVYRLTIYGRDNKSMGRGRLVFSIVFGGYGLERVKEGTTVVLLRWDHVWWGPRSFRPLYL